MPALLVFGLGRVFERHHWPAIRDSSDWELVGACDPSVARRQWFASERPGLDIADRPEDILSRCSAHAVLIATPPENHGALTELALRAGKHVLVEKPMGFDVNVARQLSSYAGSHGLHLHVGFMRRYLAAYGALRRRVSSLDPQDIQQVRIHMRFNHAAWAPISGQNNDGHGSDVLYDVASHQVDLVGWLFDSSLEQVRGKFDDQESFLWDAELDVGISVRCYAAHGPRYLERIIVETRYDVLVAEPYEFFFLPKWAAPLSAGIARGWSFCHLAFNKLTGKPSATRTSFARQLAAFADGMTGISTDSARGPDAVYMHHTLDALKDSCRRNNAWVKVERDVCSG